LIKLWARRNQQLSFPVLEAIEICFYEPISASTVLNSGEVDFIF